MEQPQTISDHVELIQIVAIWNRKQTRNVFFEQECVGDERHQRHVELLEPTGGRTVSLLGVPI
jgi:hypothetical protein